MFENLESRQFMSVTPLTADTTAVASDAPTAGVTAEAKVTTNDFHFVMKANKASPKLMTSDFGFVMKVDKASPKLML